VSLSAAEIAELAAARALLEHPGLAIKISSVVGAPLEKGLALLPASWNSAVADLTRKSIEAALETALRTLKLDRRAPPAIGWHRLAVGTTGAAGGAFGLPALALELPVSTTIMLRSIAEIARSEGEDLTGVESKLECVQVLALGGSSRTDDRAESGYFVVRAALARAVSDAARHLVQHGIAREGAPALVRLIAAVAARFSIHVTEKAAAQAIPIVGALGGALINTLFIDHFQDMARGHFVVRRLERAHGAAEVERIYREVEP
jgi:hypothetical protein